MNNQKSPKMTKINILLEPEEAEKLYQITKRQDFISMSELIMVSINTMLERQVSEMILSKEKGKNNLIKTLLEVLAIYEDYESKKIQSKLTEFNTRVKNE